MFRNPCVAVPLLSWFALGCSGVDGEGDFDDFGSGGSSADGGAGVSTGGGAPATGGEGSGGLQSGGGTPSGGSGLGSESGGWGGEFGAGGQAAGSGGASGTGGWAASGGTGGVDGTGGEPGTGGEVGAGGSEGTGGCPYSGSIAYQFNQPETWPNGMEERLNEAVTEAVYYYNCYSDLSQNLTINYKSGVPTAEGNVDGWISFGDNPSYQVTATVMHEIAHTLGVGYYPWQELIQGSRWVGAHVNDVISNLPPEERDSDSYSQRDYITADGQHFWPYGLNQASEHESEWSLINNVRIVFAMNRDKQDFLSDQ